MMPKKRSEAQIERNTCMNTTHFYKVSIHCMYDQKALISSILANLREHEAQLAENLIAWEN